MALHWPAPKVYRKRLLKLVAFLGRYGNQPAWWCWQQVTAELEELADEVGELLREEHSAGKSAAEDFD